MSCKRNDLVTDIKLDLDMLKRRSRKISGQADPNSTKVCESCQMFLEHLFSD